MPRDSQSGECSIVIGLDGRFRGQNRLGLVVIDALESFDQIRLLLRRKRRGGAGIDRDFGGNDAFGVIVRRHLRNPQPDGRLVERVTVGDRMPIVLRQALGSPLAQGRRPSR